MVDSKITLAPPTSFRAPLAVNPIIKSPTGHIVGKFDNLDALGFTQIPDKNIKKSVFLIITGKEGSGKNGLAYSAIDEGPVVEIQIQDRGTEGDEHNAALVRKGIKRKVIGNHSVDTKPGAEAVFDEFLKLLYGLYGFPGTVIVNTIEEIYEIGRVAKEVVMRREYGLINRPMTDVLSYFTRVDSPTNLVLLSKGVDVYVNGTIVHDKIDYKGYPGARGMSDCIVAIDKQTYVDPGTKKANDLVLLPIDRRFSATIMRNPAALKEEGTVLRGKDLHFSVIKRKALAL